MQYWVHTYTKKLFLGFIWNWNWTEPPEFLLAKSGNISFHLEMSVNIWLKDKNLEIPFPDLFCPQVSLQWNYKSIFIMEIINPFMPPEEGLSTQKEVLLM